MEDISRVAFDDVTLDIGNQDETVHHTAELSLGFVNYVGEDTDGKNRYEFIFTDNQDEFWGDGFESIPACLVNNLMPDERYITHVETLVTNVKFQLIQNNCCFSMQDCFDGCVALCYQDITVLDEYPEDGRLVFMFGETIANVKRKLAMKNMLFST